MKRRITGWILLIGGGTGIIISAFIGSDWPTYACIVLSCAGTVFLCCMRKEII